MAILETRGLSKRFGGVHVARDINFALEPGEIRCLIGPNGAGKSSFFRLILGSHRPNAGSILFQGEDITGLHSFQRIRRGISVKFQVPGIFKELAVHQNLEIAFQHHLRGDDLDATIDRVMGFTDLAEVAHRPAGELSHGQQQWLEIGMAVGVKPSLLLLDEPTAGMSPRETEESILLITKIVRERGVTLLFTEHDMNMVFGIANRISVLHHGAVIASGTPDAVRGNHAVQEVYLGRPTH